MDFVLASGAGDRRLKTVAAALYNHGGRHAEAEGLLRDRVGTVPERAREDHLELFARVLTARGNAAEAREIRQVLEEQRARAGYEEVLEVGRERGHRYKVGLRVAKDGAGEGGVVMEAFAGYPFAKAGVRAGDRLLVFAHREVVDLRSVWVPIREFSPGTDGPVKIRRGGEELELTVVVE